MYTSRTGLVLGFHGTDQSIVASVLNGETDLEPSRNDHDWLGNGIYFWDNSPSRALDWAKNLSKRPESKIKNPAVIGAILDLGYCLDLLDFQNLDLIKQSHTSLQHLFSQNNLDLPLNKGDGLDLLNRNLDCAVIEKLHDSVRLENKYPFDSVRGVFGEGKPLYYNADFRAKDHIQICVRNLNCIKGYFLPLNRIAF